MRMIEKILCKLGFHKWEEQYHSVYGINPIGFYLHRCKRCDVEIDAERGYYGLNGLYNFKKILEKGKR